MAGEEPNRLMKERFFDRKIAIYKKVNIMKIKPEKENLFPENPMRSDTREKSKAVGF